MWLEAIQLYQQAQSVTSLARIANEKPAAGLLANKRRHELMHGFQQAHKPLYGSQE
jgi:hypothetical protein